MKEKRRTNQRMFLIFQTTRLTKEKKSLKAHQINEIFDGEAEDMAPKRRSPDLGLPTKDEMNDHEVDHMPFRKWCEQCAAGRGTGEQHRSRDGPHAAPIIAFDYQFVTNQKVLRRDELEGVDEEVKK